MIEPFKIIPGFDNRFLATSKGEIYDVKNKCYLEQKLHQGRYRVTLKGFGRYNVHILVALAYHGKPPFENADVHHDNEDKLDNSPQNLVYLTHSVHMGLHMMFDENRREKFKKAQEAAAKLPRTEKQLESLKKAWKLPRTEKQLESLKKARSKSVIQYDLQGNFIAEYPSASEAARQTGIHLGNISSCCNGKLKSAGGYIWDYKLSNSI